jgi:AraC-like DNA-binding protein
MLGERMPPNAPSPEDGSVSILVLRALLGGARAAGLSPAVLSEESGVAASFFAESTLADPDARVPGRVAVRLWELLPKLTGNDDFGIWLAELTRSAPLTTAAWFIVSSANLEQGLERAVRFQRLLHDQATGTLEQRESEVSYVHRVGHASFRAPRHALEFGFASLVLLVRRATGRDVAPARVRFQHAEPRATSSHRRVFGTNIEFGADVDELVWSRETLELPVVTADPALTEVLLSHARSLLDRLPAGETLALRVQRLVASRLPDNAPSIDETAQALSLTRRTLQRRLKDEGTSFEDLVDDLRQKLAERYLRDQRLGVQETAFLLGYSDVSAFHRAFLRWTGLSPSRFRAEGA